MLYIHSKDGKNIIYLYQIKIRTCDADQFRILILISESLKR